MKHGDAELASNRVLTKTGDHTITNLDEVIICNKSTALTITLPAATGSGKRVTIKNVGAASPNEAKVQTIRVILRANREPSTLFLTGNLLYSYLELLISNGEEHITFQIPAKFPAKTDIKVSAIGATAFSGPVTSVLRGWLE